MTSELSTKRGSALPSWFDREPFGALRQEFDDLISRFSGTSWGAGVPSVDISETSDTVQVRMDIPGLKPEDIDIRATDQSLTIGGERRDETVEKNRTYHRTERRYGSFTRTVPLPSTVDPNKVQATYKEGVLTVELPKTSESISRKIPVKG